MISSTQHPGGKGIYDAIIVGGGIYGAVIALECARAGLSIIVVEKDEHLQGASVNSLNTLHGGLRYLQHLDFKRMRRSIYSRRYFQLESPAEIDAVPFVLPLKGWGMEGPLAMKAALMLNDLISMDRNKGLDPVNRIPGGRILSRHLMLEELPGIRRLDFSRAAIWYEAVMNNPEQLLKNLSKKAVDHGAKFLHSTLAQELRTHQGKITGLHCISDNRDITLNSNIVIDTSGRCAKRLGSSLGGYLEDNIEWARGTNMLVNVTPFARYALGLKHSDNVTDADSRFRSDSRYLFFVPGRTGTAIGTFYDHEKDIDGSLEISKADQKRYRHAVNRVMPRGKINKSDVLGWNSGWLPVAADSSHGKLNFLKSSRVHPVSVSGEFSGLIEVRSVKFTTAPAVAGDVMQILGRKAGFRV